MVVGADALYAGEVGIRLKINQLKKAFFKIKKRLVI
jgi:hypothetical protein